MSGSSPKNDQATIKELKRQLKVKDEQIAELEEYVEELKQDIKDKMLEMESLTDELREERDLAEYLRDAGYQD